MATAVERLIPDSRLMLFAFLTTSGAGRQELASVLASYRPMSVTTATGLVASSGDGIRAPAAAGGEELVTWPQLAGYLASVLTPDRAEQVWSTYRSSQRTAPVGEDHLRHLRGELALDAAEAARREQRSLLDDQRQVHRVVDGAGPDGGFQGRVQLVDDSDRVQVTVNDTELVELIEHPSPDRVIARVHHDGSWQRWSVQHVPPGDPTPAMPARFGDRVSWDVLSEDASGAAWVLMVDGYDTVIMDASNGVHPRCRVAVYDNDPTESFLRHEGVYEIAGSSSARAARRLTTPQPPAPAGGGLQR